LPWSRGWPRATPPARPRTASQRRREGRQRLAVVDACRSAIPDGADCCCCPVTRSVTTPRIVLRAARRSFRPLAPLDASLEERNAREEGSCVPRGRRSRQRCRGGAMPECILRLTGGVTGRERLAVWPCGGRGTRGYGGGRWTARCRGDERYAAEEETA
jgi:hypothetical protein